MKIPKLILLLSYEESRKVGFGMWLFIVATFLITKKMIDGPTWMWCAGLSSALIGGGTVLDRYLGGKEKTNAVPTQTVGRG